MRWPSAGLIIFTMSAVGRPIVSQQPEAVRLRALEALLEATRVTGMRAALAPLAVQGEALRASRLLMELQGVQLQERAMQSRALAELAVAGVPMRAPMAPLAPMALLELVNRSFSSEPPAASLPADPGDSIYRAARLALSRGRYREAADGFRTLRTKFPDSGYAGDAMYWQAFALYRQGGIDRMREASTVLSEQKVNYPDAATKGDARALALRIQSELARLGDNRAAEAIAAYATSGYEATRGLTRQEQEARAMAFRYVRDPAAPRAATLRATRDDCGNDDESDMKVAAINGLMQMDADRAVPILRRVLARRDSASACLRRKAIFLIAQKQTEGTEDILLDAARNDPDAQVKQQAVFWLSQVHTEKAAAALDSILRRSTDPELQEKALFALAQQGGTRATSALRTFAERSDVSEEMREKAIFWMGQTASPENWTFLRQMYGRTKSTGLRQKILFSLAQSGGKENEKFLLDIARNKDESIDARKQALFWAGQSGSIGSAELGSLYASIPDREMREQIVFVLSQRNDAAAMDKLIDIARRDPDPNMRKRALFWVGQSKDPRATQLLQDILEDK
ncbi:MAG: HEAT repeat domain-containing protein [Gemmatimonadales bacterium]|nr:HEAT repeat domain-containing protein [Gemmatimonadales bacterium]